MVSTKKTTDQTNKKPPKQKNLTPKHAFNHSLTESIGFILSLAAYNLSNLPSLFCSSERETKTLFVLDNDLDEVRPENTYLFPEYAELFKMKSWDESFY